MYTREVLWNPTKKILKVSIPDNANKSFQLDIVACVKNDFVLDWKKWPVDTSKLGALLLRNLLQGWERSVTELHVPQSVFYVGKPRCRTYTNPQHTNMACADNYDVCGIITSFVDGRLFQCFRGVFKMWSNLPQCDICQKYRFSC